MCPSTTAFGSGRPIHFLRTPTRPERPVLSLTKVDTLRLRRRGLVSFKEGGTRTTESGPTHTWSDEVCSVQKETK